MADRLKIVRLLPGHLDELGDPELCIFLNEDSWCALLGTRPVAAGGICEPYWQGRGHCWFARIEKDFDWRWWPQLTREVKKAADRALESGRCRRLEMTIKGDDEGAKNWATKLGFYPEASCKKLMQNGEDGWVYVRV